MPLVFFMAPTDPRMISTINAILKTPRDGGLVSDSLVYRFRRNPALMYFRGRKALFNMCSFWLVEALTRQVWQMPKSWITPGCCLNVCWVTPIISGFIQNKQGRKARRWAIFRRPLHI
jgi:hypothetical protein